MTRKEIESSLKLCTEHVNKCALCPYVARGCFRALMQDSLRYIGWLKQNEKNAHPPKGKGVHGKR